MIFNNKTIGKDRFEIEDIKALDEKELLEYQIAVMQWYRDGGEVEVQYHEDEDRLKADDELPYWNWERVHYFPVPKPSYSERQAKWVEENNVKVGQKVKCLPFTDYEDGFYSCVASANEFFYKIVKVRGIDKNSILVDYDGISWYFPYFALELIKPTYKPYEKADPAWLVKTDEVVKHKDRNRFTKIEGIDNDGKQKIAGITNSNWLTLQEMFKYYEWYNLATGETRPFGEEV